MIDQNRLLEKAEKLGIAQVPVQALDTYAELLVEYNQKVNLTAITDPEGIEDKHFIDSLLFAPARAFRAWWQSCTNRSCSSL